MAKDIILEKMPPTEIKIGTTIYSPVRRKHGMFYEKYISNQDITVLQIMKTFSFRDSIIDAAKKLRRRNFPRNKSIQALCNYYGGFSPIEIEGYFDLAIL